MKLVYFIIFIIGFLSKFRSTKAFQEDSFLDGQLNLIIEDSLDDPNGKEFSPRSTVHVRSVKSGNAVISHTRDWSPSHTKALKNLADSDGLYRIRILQKGAESKGYVSTFTKACLFLESQLSETLTIMLDSAGSSVVGVGLYTPLSYCEGIDDVPLLATLNSTVMTRSPIQAPVPDTATYVQKIEAMKTEKAEGRDNRSFLSKYWMYIVPVVLILLVSGGAQEK